MYDRKTWIVLATCGLLLALNFYLSSKNRPEPTAKPPAIETPALVEGEAPAALTVETPPPPTEEEFITLQNEKVVFTLTNIGGGIKHTEFKDQKNVGETSRVRINLHGAGPIAGFVNSKEALDSTPFAYKQDLSVPGKTVVYIAKLPSGVVVKKTYALETENIPGAPYFLNLTLEFQNTTPADFDLSEYGLFLGSAAPLYQAERPTHTGFFWYEGGKMHFEAATAFKGGWFSSEKSVIRSEQGEEVKYAGVTDQFFSTVIRPEKPAATRVWGKPHQVTLKTDDKAVSAVRAALALPSVNLTPGTPLTLKYRIFTGPKANTMLRKLENTKAAGDGWGDMMQYGWFGLVSRTLNWLLNFLHTGLNKLSTEQSWGLSIICLTLIVRIFIWPLHAKSTHTMKRMSKLQPKMAELKEKYADDPTKLNTEMMGLYRKYGINPLGGCLPMLIQIPIFFG